MSASTWPKIRCLRSCACINHLSLLSPLPNTSATHATITSLVIPHLLLVTCTLPPASTNHCTNLTPSPTSVLVTPITVTSLVILVTSPLTASIACSSTLTLSNRSHFRDSLLLEPQKVEEPLLTLPPSQHPIHNGPQRPQPLQLHKPLTRDPPAAHLQSASCVCSRRTSHREHLGTTYLPTHRYTNLQSTHRHQDALTPL